MKKLIEIYQCPGCINGPDPSSCEGFKQGETGCLGHQCGTMGFGTGRIFLGLPKGFNRVGTSKDVTFCIYENPEEALDPSKATFNIVVWKHLDENGNTLIRVYSPRVNYGCAMVIRGDHLDKFPAALLITDEIIGSMD